MMKTLARITLLFSISPSSLAFAAEEPDAVVSPPTPTLSSELLDSTGLTRFHLATRATFADGDKAFSSGFAWSYEARAHVRIIEGLAVSAVVPFGIHKGDSTDAYLGNLAIGLGGGGEVLGGAVALRLGGGIDGYLPTTSGGEAADDLSGASFLAAIRSYEPQLYIPRTAAIRGRGSLDLAVGDFRAAVEASLTPIFTTKGPSRFAMLLGGALRASYQVTTSVEPFLELGCSTQIAGTGDVAPPFLLTPGVRFHVADLFDPAIFASFNFVAAPAVIFGVDLAFALRPSKKDKKSDRDILDSRDDFL